MKQEAQTPAMGGQEAVAQAQQDVDKAWADDKTGLGLGETTGAAAPALETDDLVPADAVVLPKGGKPAAVPPTGAPAPSETPAPAGDKPAAPDAPAAAEPPAKTAEERLSSYWDKITGTPGFENATVVTQSPRFLAWFETLSPSDKAAAGDVDHPEKALSILGRYNQDLNDGKVSEPKPPEPPAAVKVEEFLKARGLDTRTVLNEEGQPVTLADLAKGGDDGYGPEIAGMMAIFAENAQVQAVEQARALVQGLIRDGVLVTRTEFDRIRQKFDANEMGEKDPGALAVSETPEFKAFLEGSKLLSRAWNNGNVEDRLEVVSVFNTRAGKTAVDSAAAAQRRSLNAKNRLQQGTLRGGMPSARKTGEGEETPEQQVDRAWNDPTPVE